jgi:hypothetical protein
MGKLWCVALGLGLLMTPTTSASLLAPNSFGATSTASGSSINALFDGSGLFGNLHNTLAGDMWLADNVNTGSPFPYVEINAGFGQGSMIRSLKIWNYNSGDLAQGAKRVEIRYNSGGFNMSAGIYTLSQGTGGALGGQIIVLPTEVLASSIQILILDNYGNETNVGLSEVQFYSNNLLEEFDSGFGGGTGGSGTGGSGTGGSGTGGSGTGGSGTGGSGSGGSGTVPTGTTPTNVEEIPEPATWVMVAAGMALMGIRRKR